MNIEMTTTRTKQNIRNTRNITFTANTKIPGVYFNSWRKKMYTITNGS